MEPFLKYTAGMRWNK